MSSQNKGALYLVSFILGIYYGVIPLLGFEVWTRISGWTRMSNMRAFIHIIINRLQPKP